MVNWFITYQTTYSIVRYQMSLMSASRNRWLETNKRMCENGRWVGRYTAFSSSVQSSDLSSFFVQRKDFSH